MDVQVEYKSLSAGSEVRIVSNGISTPVAVIAFEPNTDTLVVRMCFKDYELYICYHLKGKVSPPNPTRSQYRRGIDWLCSWR
jgi:hypothetical protein